VGKQVKQHREAAKERQHAHMAELVMAVDPPTPTASPPASPPALTPLPVITTINGNSRIIPAPAFIPKTLPAAIAAKPIPRRYTGSMETRPSVWVNTEKHAI